MVLVLTRSCFYPETSEKKRKKKKKKFYDCYENTGQGHSGKVKIRGSFFFGIFARDSDLAELPTKCVAVSCEKLYLPRINVARIIPATRVKYVYTIYIHRYLRN